MTLLLLGPGPGAPAPPPGTSMPVIGCSAFDRYGNLLTLLPDAFNRQWQERISQEGSGSVEVLATDPALALIPRRSLLRFTLNGQAVFSSVVEDRATKVVAQGDEHDETTILSGRGLTAIFEEAVVYPEGGVTQQPFSDTRVFDYANPALDDSAWPYAVQIKKQSSTLTPYGGTPPKPDGWLDHDAWWIWGVGPPYPFPSGDCFFRNGFTKSTEGTVRYFFSADDGVQLKVDGVEVGSDTRAFLWGETKQVDVFHSAGYHLVAMRGTNLPRPSSPSTNGAALIMSAYEINADGALGALLLHTDGSWKCLAYPADAPGFTPGAILRILLEEGQARGVLGGCSLAFDDVYDSAGVPWSVVGEAFQVGMDYQSVIQQLCDAYMDVKMSPTVPRLFAYQTLSIPSTVKYRGGRVFADGAVNATSNTLTSPALAQFTADDVGLGVEGPGIPTGTTIVAFISATQVTMSTGAIATRADVSVSLVGNLLSYDHDEKT